MREDISACFNFTAGSSGRLRARVVFPWLSRLAYIEWWRWACAPRGLPENKKFFRAITNGRIAFSAGLLSIEIIRKILTQGANNNLEIPWTDRVTRNNEQGYAEKTKLKEKTGKKIAPTLDNSQFAKLLQKNNPL